MLRNTAVALEFCTRNNKCFVEIRNVNVKNSVICIYRLGRRNECKIDRRNTRKKYRRIEYKFGDEFRCYTLY